MDILLIRSGMTDYENQGRVQGQLDLPLSSEGRQQVAEMVAQLAEQWAGPSIGWTYTGPGQAAVATAEMVAAALGSKWKKLDGLRNIDLGLWQGKLVEELRIQQPKAFRLWHEQPDLVCPPEGELVADARLRVAEVLAKLAGKRTNGNRGGNPTTIALVVPEPLATLVAWEITKQQPSGMQWTSAYEGRRWEWIKQKSEPLVTR